MLHLKIIVGSTREGRFSEKVLPWLTEELTKNQELTYEVLDLRDWEMPFFDYAVSPAYITDGNYPNEVAKKFAAKIAEADGYLIIAPEYNHGYTAVLKNALDSIYAEWNKKPVGFISYGSVGGGRVVEQLRQVAVELQMAPVRSAVHIQSPWNLLEQSGQLKAGALQDYAHSFGSLMEQMVWWGKALKAARAGQ